MICLLTSACFVFDVVMLLITLLVGVKTLAHVDMLLIEPVRFYCLASRDYTPANTVAYQWEVYNTSRDL
ncbi:hypothetical protein SLEP1_g17549 [Rubroshorea leprosula]|uniref:Uncharacterized protein n=1 Tax=Rubroshorea leprosula TaxID=152421 RepID=A0AAV5IUN0_9ROSI|nr:hypothetical protein SLEP1_g17549 [Rubroshorea leprosula]